MLEKLLLDAERRPVALRLYRTLLRHDREHTARDMLTLVELLNAGCKHDPVASALLRRDILAILAEEFDGNASLKAHSTPAIHHIPSGNIV
jgi:hypothetical protein